MKEREQLSQIKYGEVMKKIIFFTVISLSLFLVGCATIFNGSTEKVAITSNVNGASIFLDGVLIGKTPFAGEMNRNGDTLLIKMKGYKSYTLELNTETSGTVFLNIFSGLSGLLFTTTDVVSGAAYKYAPSSFQVDLIPEENVSLIKFKNMVKLRKFAMLNISNISINLSNNSGPYLDAIIHLSNLENTPNAIEIIRKNIKASRGNQVVFGKLMVSLLES